MTTYSDDEAVAAELLASCDVPTRGDCGEVHNSLDERLACAACNHAIATNSRPWMYDDKALFSFTRVVEETGILNQQRSQKEKSRDE